MSKLIQPHVKMLKKQQVACILCVTLEPVKIVKKDFAASAKEGGKIRVGQSCHLPLTQKD